MYQRTYLGNTYAPSALLTVTVIKERMCTAETRLLRFEVPVVTLLNIHIFWDVALCW
jgi:hypothetical protein